MNTNIKRLILPIGLGAVSLIAFILAIVVFVTGRSEKALLNAKIVQQNEIISGLQTDLNELSQTITVYRAKVDIKSGNTIKDSDLESIQVSTMFSAGYTTKAEDLVGNVAIADIAEGSYITKDFVYPVEIKSDYRTLDVICDKSPIGFNIGDTIDVRITFPNGQDFILLSKKLINDVYGNVVQIVVDEKDILIYKSAEADWARFTKNGTAGAAVQIYCTTYVAAGAQTSSSQYYPIQTKLPDGQTFEGSTYWVALNDYNLSESDLSNWLAVDRDKLERALRDYDYYWTDTVTYDATYKYREAQGVSNAWSSSNTASWDWKIEEKEIVCLDNDDAREIAIKNAFGERALTQSTENIITLKETDRYRTLDTAGGSTAVNLAKLERDKAYITASEAYTLRQNMLTEAMYTEQTKMEEQGLVWEDWDDAKKLQWTKEYIDGVDVYSYIRELEEQKKQEEEENKNGVGADEAGDGYVW